ncbi:hypothetical protein BpHYR1_035795 [Brachionus plicatilis]|uniref:MATH domain-containing protein n=1 Tax=Brachionus plicatilis TaxID=10195 RepID=A0A3M7QTS4_BRAPC|nr:hypothetical protein BpHYR1_035795 [Brachionus plicatilis]
MYLLDADEFKFKKKRFDKDIEKKICKQFNYKRSFDGLKREVDLRREEIKYMINKKIDDYYNGLLEKIDIERNLKLKELEERIQQIETLNLVKFDANKNLEISSKLDFFEKNKNEIENEPKFKLTDSCEEIDIKKIFGEFNIRENIIQLTINNFSLLKDRKNFILYSKKCIVRNFEWFIKTRLNEDDGEMEFYLFCNSIEKSNVFSVKVNAESDLKNFSRYGYPKFTNINEIMNPAKGYYDTNEDLITLKANLKAELPLKKRKNRKKGKKNNYLTFSACKTDHQSQK